MPWICRSKNQPNYKNNIWLPAMQLVLSSTVFWLLVNWRVESTPSDGESWAEAKPNRVTSANNFFSPMIGGLVEGEMQPPKAKNGKSRKKISHRAIKYTKGLIYWFETKIYSIVRSSVNHHFRAESIST